jgi:polygalacturonase
LNVTNYGATPYDLIPDDAAVQRAVAAALPGDTVFFPNGMFVITNSIHPKSNLRITGETQTGAIIQYQGIHPAEHDCVDRPRRHFRRQRSG